MFLTAALSKTCTQREISGHPQERFRASEKKEASHGPLQNSSTLEMILKYLETILKT